MIKNREYVLQHVAKDKAQAVLYCTTGDAEKLGPEEVLFRPRKTKQPGTAPGQRHQRREKGLHGTRNKPQEYAKLCHPVNFPTDDINSCRPAKML